MTVIGADIGKRRLALAFPDSPEAYHIDLGDASSGLSRDDELVLIQRFVTPLAQYRVWPHLFIEEPYLSGGPAANAMTTIGLAETVTALRLAWRWTSVTLVNPSTWKSAVVGNFRASKDEISGWLLEQHPALHRICRTEDEIDAMCIGIYGKMRLSGEASEPERKKRARRRAAPQRS